jgi:hypothetical protein
MAADIGELRSFIPVPCRRFPPNNMPLATSDRRFRLARKPDPAGRKWGRPAFFTLPPAKEAYLCRAPFVALSKDFAYQAEPFS